jgi:FkbM family methyltransferase
MAVGDAAGGDASASARSEVLAGSKWLRRAIFTGKRRRLDISLVREFLGDTPGTFIEVGANDPFRGSQTWHLEEAGWNGLLVEPLSEHADRLRQNRKAQVAEAACVGPELAGKTLALNVAGPGGVQSTLAEEFVEPEIAAEEARNVEAATLDALLEKFAIDRVDFLSVDVEGLELDVLRGFSLERYRPRLILLEDRVRDRRLHCYMLARNYRLVRRTGQNAWYVPKSILFWISPRGQWELFRKYYLAPPLKQLKLARKRRSARNRR